MRKLPSWVKGLSHRISGLPNMSSQSRNLKLPFDKKGMGVRSANTWSAKYELSE